MTSDALTHRNSALSLNNLHYTFTDDWTRKKTEVLKGISLEVLQGEAFGFLGHNGAGKTTAIKAVLGLIQLTKGHVEIFGHPWSTSEARRAVGYLPEQPYFYDHLSVDEILRLYACLVGIPRSQRADSINRVLGLVGLVQRRKSRMRALSKGLTQRVALAQALIGSPKLLILDEPFSGLDPIGRREFRDIFVALKREGVTIFISSHILSDVEFLCDRASIMVRGQLKGVFDLRNPPEALSGTHFELIVRADTSFLSGLPTQPSKMIIEDRFLRMQFLERPAADGALKHALAQGLEIQSFELEHASLEEVFMDIIRREGVAGSV